MTERVVKIILYLFKKDPLDNAELVQEENQLHNLWLWISRILVIYMELFRSLVS